MTNGKHTCKMLKQIRQKIAEKNGIEFVTQECRFKGDCSGTCPKCEAEVRYLEQQLQNRRLIGKSVAIAGISAGMLLMSGYNAVSYAKPAQYDDPNILRGETYDKIVCVEDSMPEFDPDMIFYVTEENALFPGGQSALLKFIADNIHLPDSLPDDFMGGRVVVRFVIDKTGKAHSPVIMRSKSKELDMEAMRIIEILPTFTPAKMNGQFVNCYYTLPVTFCRPKNNP